MRKAIEVMLLAIATIGLACAAIAVVQAFDTMHKDDATDQQQYCKWAAKVGATQSGDYIRECEQ